MSVQTLGTKFHRLIAAPGCAFKDVTGCPLDSKTLFKIRVAINLYQCMIVAQSVQRLSYSHGAANMGSPLTLNRTLTFIATAAIAISTVGALVAQTHAQSPSAESSLIAIPTKPWDLAALEKPLKAQISSLLAQGKNAQALCAAKSYYNLVELKNTKDAVELLAGVLAKSDPTAADRFRAQQSSASATALTESVLSSITIDDAPYEAAIESFRSKSDSIDNQIGAGNLLLLADRPDEAQACFEFALHLSTKGKGGKTRSVRESLSGIARSIRAREGWVARADAFILSLQQQGVTSVSGEASRSAQMSRAIHEAVAQVVTSTLIPLDAASVAALSPANLTTKASAEPKLASWLNDWQQTIKDGAEVTVAQREALQALLEATFLPSLTLIEIGRATHFQSSDNLTTAAFYAAAAYRADDELDAYAPGA